jgi:hypothetical protein
LIAWHFTIKSREPARVIRDSQGNQNWRKTLPTQAIPKAYLSNLPFANLWRLAASFRSPFFRSAMKKSIFAIVMLTCGIAAAQNWTTVSAANITDLNQQKLAAGQLCFLATDQSDNPISIGIGGGGQALRRQYCAQITAGGVTPFTVPNPTNTLPPGVYYRVTVKDSSTGQEVLRYAQVSFAGSSFNFDNYTPLNLGAPAPISGASVTGNLSVTGNISATGSLIGSNLPANILQQIFNSGTGLTQRTAFNMLAGITCSDNAGTSRTDCRLGTLNTLVFSATPVFDASTASTFKLTLTGNVTSSTLTNAVAGEPLAFEICQDSTGGRTFVPPANVQGWVTIPSAANACVLETFIHDGTNAVADGDTAGQVLAQDGAAATPSISFENNTNTGFYRIAANRVGLALTGLNSVDFQNAITIFNSGTVKTNNYVLDINNADAGISRMAAAKIGFGNGTNGNTSATMEGRALQLDGATSGSVTLAVPAAAGANTWTIPAATDTAVGRATTDTLTNKSITSPVISDPTITGTALVKRFRANQGSALVVADVGSLTGFGNTASVSAVSGTDTAGSVNITSSGTGQAVNASFTLTFHDGAFPVAPIVIVTRGDGNPPTGGYAVVFNATTANVTIGFANTPVAGSTYSFNFVVIGK